MSNENNSSKNLALRLNNPDLARSSKVLNFVRNIKYACRGSILSLTEIFPSVLDLLLNDNEFETKEKITTKYNRTVHYQLGV